MTDKCVHCGRDVMNMPDGTPAKVCQSCFLFAMAKLLDRDGILPEELDGLTIAKCAEIFGNAGDAFAFKCWCAVFPAFGMEKDKAK